MEYDELRSLRLLSVLDLLGLQSEFKPRKGGSEWSGACPICKPKRNKTAFSFDATGRFHCFSCNAKGKGAIDLVMQVQGVGFKEAVRWLQSNRLGVANGQPKIDSSHRGAPESPSLGVSENPAYKGSYEKFYVPSDWLKRRGFSQETLKSFGVGQYDNPARSSPYKGKIMLPIKRFADGEVVAYLARNPEPKEGEPKYIFPKNFHKSLELYGAWQIKNSGQLPLRIIYLVESPFCVLAFHQKGLPAVSPFGWSLSEQQIQIIKQITKGVIYLPDQDKAKDIATFAHSLSLHVWVKCPPLPEGIRDPEHLTLEQIKQLA